MEKWFSGLAWEYYKNRDQCVILTQDEIKLK